MNTWSGARVPDRRALFSPGHGATLDPMDFDCLGPRGSRTSDGSGTSDGRTDGLRTHERIRMPIKQQGVLPPDRSAIERVQQLPRLGSTAQKPADFEYAFPIPL